MFLCFVLMHETLDLIAISLKKSHDHYDSVCLVVVARKINSFSKGVKFCDTYWGEDENIARSFLAL